MHDAALIGLDWGSSRLRAYLMSRAGAVVEARDSDAGASRLAAGAEPAARGALFERHLRELVADWLAPGRTMIACGMVGSAHGWREAEYVPCPVDLNELHRHLTLVRGTDGLELWIVPGASYRPSEHAPDVMRGEETQVIGVLAQDASWAAGASIVLPGTHSKWVRIVDGQLVSFATRMTGEMFDVLRSHSVLSRSLADVEPARSETNSSVALPHRAKRVVQTSRACCSVFERCTCSASRPRAALARLSVGSPDRTRARKRAHASATRAATGVGRRRTPLPSLSTRARELRSPRQRSRGRLGGAGFGLDRACGRVRLIRSRTRGH